MGWKIVWTDPALDDLAELVRYIAGDDSDAAVRVGDKIVDHVEILTTFPEIGPVFRRRSRGDIRQILSSPFRIFYRLDHSSNAVQILHVWHSARQFPEDL